jgi:hypothetical protein
MDGLFPIRPRREGAVLDAVLTNPDVERYPLEELAVPTLIIHAADDTLAHYETAPRAAARIPGARLVPIDRDGHLFAGREAVVRQKIGAFIGVTLFRIQLGNQRMQAPSPTEGTKAKQQSRATAMRAGRLQDWVTRAGLGWSNDRCGPRVQAVVRLGLLT